MKVIPLKFGWLVSQTTMAWSLASLVFIAAGEVGSAQTVVFRETFEGNFPQDGGWSVGDQNFDGEPAYWDDVDLTEFGTPPARSTWAGYCAGAGYWGDPFEPHYQPTMISFMSKSLDLTGQTSATLSFWHTVPSIESGIDQCAVFVDDLAVYISSSPFNWTQTSIDLSPYAGLAIDLAFVFFSDDSVEGEGWYLDDILVTGTGTSTSPLARGPYLQTMTTNSVTLRWRTTTPLPSLVAYGTSAQQLTGQAGDSTPKTEHAVTIGGLDANTRYFYALMNGAESISGGADHSFVTFPVSAKPTRLWAIGDSGSATPQARAVYDQYLAMAGSRHTDVWLMLGDNAYGVGTDAEYQQAVFDMYPELLRQTAVWSTMGNHETYSNDPNGQHAYFNIFNFPTAGQAGGVPSGTEHYYSFDHGNIHIICLDSEESGRTPGSPMLTWLEQDLAANTKDWTIAMWHSPPYTKGSHDSDNTFDSTGRMQDMRANIVPILESHGVDLVLCGHSHNYERSFLMEGHYGFSDTLTPAMFVDAGSGRVDETGAYEKPISGPNANRGTVYIVAGSSGWATFVTGRHPVMHTALLEMGSLVLDIDGDRLDAKFLRETGTIDDYFTILKTALVEPVIIGSFSASAGNVFLQWHAQVGKSYRVEKTFSLNSPEWTAVGADVVAAGPLAAWGGAVNSPTGKAFFRVQQLD